VTAAGIAYLLGKRLWPLPSIAAFGGLAVLLVDTINLSHALDSFQSQMSQAGGLSAAFAAAVSVSAGTGLYLCWIGLLIALGAGVWGFNGALRATC